MSHLRQPRDVELLPKTFREVFHILRRLGIRYIWIHRFCIVQDSETDWQTQASVMGEIYKSSFVCISALGAPDDDAGCFYDRDIEDVKPFVVTLSPDGHSPPRQYVNDKDPYRWQDKFSEEALARRAWVDQERVLAPRTLHFGRTQIYWECYEGFCCETDPDFSWIWNLTNNDKLYPPPGPHIWKTLINSAGAYRQTNLPAWCLNYYGRCQLTHSSDKLVAILAVAKDVRRALKNLEREEKYLAVIWNTWLPNSLLWFILPDTALENRPTPYRAPSWSWASVDGGVHSAQMLFADPLVSVSDAMTLPLTDDTGQVLGGMITLTGKLMMVTIEDCGSGPWKPEESGVVNQWKICGFNTVEGFPILCNAQPSYDGRRMWPNGSVIFDTEADMCNDAMFLPISTFHFRQFGYPSNQYCGLLLSKVEATYRRLGLLHMSVADENEPET